MSDPIDPVTPEKTDYLHRFLKHVDYNRYTYGILAAVALLAGCSFLPGYDGKAIDPVTGEIASSDELQASLIKTEAELNEQFDAYGRMIAQGLEGQRAVVAKAERLTPLFQEAQAQVADEQAAAMEALQGLANLVTLGNPSAAPVVGTILGLAGVGFGVGRGADAKRKDRQIVIRDQKIANLVNQSVQTRTL